MSETIRKAKEEDREQVDKLLFDNFGEMAVERGALDEFPACYTVSEEDGKVVAMSGIIGDHSLFDGYEVGWTCCDKDYRRQGRITRILKKCLDELPNDSIPVWCDSWKVRNKECNLKSVLDNLGFKLYMVNVMVYNKLFMKVCRTCPYKDESEECHCVANLYKKER